MPLAAPLLVTMMLLDFLQPLSQPTPVLPQTAYAEAGTGELTVSVLPSGTIGSVPRGATRVSFLTINLSASCESDIRVSSIVLTHRGLGSSDDIASVYGVDGFTRITRAARFDRRSGEVTLRFRSLTIPKCSAMMFTVFADMSPDATVASEHALLLSAASAVSSSAKKTVLEISAALGKMIAAPVDAGSLTARLLSVSRNVRYGRIETVARLQLTADTRTAQLLKKITFTNRGSARDMDLQWLDLELLSGSVLTAPAPRMRRLTATLEFSPTFILHAGETRVFNLKAEIHGSQSRTIDFFLLEPSDLVAAPYRER